MVTNLKSSEVAKKELIVDRKYIIGLSVFCLINTALGQSMTEGIGNTLFVLQSMVHKICLVTGIGCVIGGFIQYKMYRDNPSNVRLSMPIWLWIIGFSLIGLVYLPSPITDPTQ
jgi:hypothetical protein